jgi:hypothetical protein
MHIRSLSVVTALSFLVACAAPSVDGPVFGTLEPPGDGYARVYLFRPGFSRISRSDTPALFINDIEVGSLVYESYLSLAFGPGTHRISLKPTLMDSSVWKIDYDFSVQAGRTYFLAAWNTVDAAGGIPVWIPVLPIPGTHLLLVQEGRIGGNTGVRLQFVGEDEALPVLRELRLVKPKQDVFLRP